MFINKSLIKLITIGSLFILLIIQLIFNFLLQREANVVLNGLNSIFRNEIYASNPYLIAREILDLESIGKIKCPQLSTSSVIYLKPKNCSTSFIFLDQVFTSKSIESSTGVSWTISGYIPANNYFLVALWLSRILAVAVFCVTVLYLNSLKLAHQLKLEKSQAMERIARQVAHDIASPLTSINLVTLSLSIPAKEKEMITAAVKRITAMTDELVNQHKSTWHNKSIQEQHLMIEKIEDGSVRKSVQSSLINEPINILKTIELMIAEKRLQYSNQSNVQILSEIDESDEILISINEVELSRLLSNLINNSVEALESQAGKVTLAVRNYSDKAVIEVRDNGKGIPEQIIEQLGQMGVSYGKESNDQSGSGLGLYHAKNTVEAAGGSLNIQSKVGFGTVMRMTFKKKLIF